MRLRKSVIRNGSEEGQCAPCGFPLYVGNVAVFITEDGEETEGPFCGTLCAKEANDE